MKSSRAFLAAVLLMVVGSTANALDGIKGEYRPSLYGNSPNAIGDIKGEYTPNVYTSSWNALGDIKGEFAPNLGGDRPNAYDNQLTPPWYDVPDYLLPLFQIGL